jgi:hypothetical protein
LAANQDEAKKDKKAVKWHGGKLHNVVGVFVN